MKLALEDGTLTEGVAFGAAGAVCGEGVFNTGMAGYVATLTDPSYSGEILVLTYPLIGHCGVPPPRPSGSIDAPFESARIQIQALVVQNYVADFSHRAAAWPLGEWLAGEQVPAVTGIDTRTLMRRLRVLWHADLADLAGDVDGNVIGNGPGDPLDLSDLVEKIRALLGRFDEPIFGICLGNQILALAAGGSTYKLPYGHRGVNQPVQDLLTRRCYVTSQNHGHAVDNATFPDGWEAWFANINDGTNEGIRSQTKPHFGVQFHPEAGPGPEDTGFLFDEFIGRARAMSGR